MTESSIEALVKKYNAIVFTCTYYSDPNDVRLHQCLKTLQDPKFGASVIPIVVVDGSPPDVHEMIKSSSNAIVYKESKMYGKGKGGALREALQMASLLPGANESTWLCWQEPEKSDMLRCWVNEVFSGSGVGVSSMDDVICPMRKKDCFQASYPIEQYHSETYGNYYLNGIMKEQLDKMEYKCDDIDWHFGPFALRKKTLYLWMEYKGTSYDAQVIPVVAAIRKQIYRINCSIQVSFKLDANMKQQEEGSLDFIEKRLHQLNDLDPKVKQFWKDPLYC